MSIKDGHVVTVEPPRPEIKLDFEKLRESWKESQQKVEADPAFKDFFESIEEDFGTKIDNIKDRIQQFADKVESKDTPEIPDEIKKLIEEHKVNPNAAPDYKFPGNEGHGDVLPNRPVMKDDGTFGYPEGHGDTLPIKPIMKFPNEGYGIPETMPDLIFREGNGIPETMPDLIFREGNGIPETMPEIHFDPENIDNMPIIDGSGNGRVKPVPMPQVGGHDYGNIDNMPRVGVPRPTKQPPEATTLPDNRGIKDIFGGATKIPEEGTILPDRHGIKSDSPRKIGPENYLNGGNSHSRFENQLPSDWTSGAGANSNSASYTPEATN